MVLLDRQVLLVLRVQRVLQDQRVLLVLMEQQVLRDQQVPQVRQALEQMPFQ